MWGIPGVSSGKESACQCRRSRRRGFDPWVERFPLRRTRQPTPGCKRRTQLSTKRRPKLSPGGYTEFPRQRGGGWDFRQRKQHVKGVLLFQSLSLLSYHVKAGAVTKPQAGRTTSWWVQSENVCVASLRSEYIRSNRR